MRHKHYCVCGEYFTCAQDRDKCQKDWTCPACEDRDRDAYFELQERLRLAETFKRLTRAAHNTNH